MSGLAAHAEEFLRRLSQERRLSPRTVSAYRGDLHLLLQKAEEDGGRGAMQPRDIRRWLMAERARKISPTSIARRLSAWRMFFDYLTRNGVAASNPARGIRPPKKAARLPRALTPDEMARFLDAKESSAPTSNIRADFAKTKAGNPNMIPSRNRLQMWNPILRRRGGRGAMRRCLSCCIRRGCGWAR